MRFGLFVVLVFAQRFRSSPMLSAAAAGHSVAASTTSSGSSSVSCNTNGHTKAEMSMASASSSGNGSPAAAGGEESPNGVNGGGCEQDEQDEQKEVDIVINNVVGSFSVKCHLNLRDIALRGHNVEYRRENGVRSTQRQNYIAHRLHMVKSAV